jgi:hypothetical protein
MPSPPTKTGTRKLSDVARHVVVPDGIVSTGYPAVRDKCRDLGFIHDDWQQGLGRLVLGKRADGKYAATIGGVVISIPRQVGKTFTIGTVVFALCLIFPRLTVLWTAHRTRTSNETFQKMRGWARRKKIAPHIEWVRATNGEQEVRFGNGSRIMFGAREAGFGRGFDEVDVEVFDEAQILSETALEDMVAATNQCRHPHGALLFYMGTPPRPKDPGDMFRNKRAKALKGESADMVYIELSADDDASPDDRKQWAKANPSYPRRTPLESMLRLRENVGSDDAMLREGMGVWDEEDRSKALPGWLRCATTREPPPPAALGIAADLDQVWLALGAAGRGEPMHVGSVLRLRVEEREQFIAEVKRIQSEHSIPAVVDKGGPASFLIPELEAAGVWLHPAGRDDFVQACADLRGRVDSGTVEHGNYDELNAAVDSAGWRPMGDRRVFARKGGDISSLEAVTWAAWLAGELDYDVLDSVL